MGTDCKSAAFQLRWFESTRAHQKASAYTSTLRFLFCNKAGLIERVDSNSYGAVAEDSAKTARWAVFSSAARDIHPRPPRTPVSEPGTGVSVLLKLFQGWAGGFEQQRSRPPPVAETGRRGWGRGQRDGCGKRKKHVNPQRINVPFWSEQRDLNPRPLRPERSALPTALCPENTAAFRLRSGWG